MTSDKRRTALIAEAAARLTCIRAIELVTTDLAGATKADIFGHLVSQSLGQIHDDL